MLAKLNDDPASVQKRCFASLDRSQSNNPKYHIYLASYQRREDQMYSSLVLLHYVLLSPSLEIL